MYVFALHGRRTSNAIRSLVIEDALAAFAKHQSPPPAYFYCSRNTAEPGRSDPNSVLRSLARQLSCLEPSLPLLGPTVAAYKTQEEQAFAAKSLQLRETCSLILNLVEHYPAVTMIIDALDECNPATRKDLLGAMELILRESPSLVKIFVSSRDDQDIVYKLQGYPSLQLSSDRNSGDIAQFVESETNSLIASANLLLFSTRKDELRQKIIREVTNGAGGMYVSHWNIIAQD